MSDVPRPRCIEPLAIGRAIVALIVGLALATSSCKRATPPAAVRSIGDLVALVDWASSPGLDPVAARAHLQSDPSLRDVKVESVDGRYYGIQAGIVSLRVPERELTAAFGEHVEELSLGAPPPPGSSEPLSVLRTWRYTLRPPHAPGTVSFYVLPDGTDVVIALVAVDVK